MASPFNISQKLLSTYRSFGVKALAQELKEILRYKIFNSRKYISMALRPQDFIAVEAESETTLVLAGKPGDLVPFASESFELTEDFLKEIGAANAVMAKDFVTGDLLGYGFFSSERIAIDEGQVFFNPPPAATYLFKFFVSPHARGERIVRRLMAKVIEVQDPKYSKLYVANVIANNFTSLRAFSSMGFERKKDFFLIKDKSDVWCYE